MSILIINAGSATLKYKLFDEAENELKSGRLESVVDHSKAIKQILKEIGDLRDLKAAGHRIVHGGGKFDKTILIDEQKIEEIEQFSYMAPLHNPFNLVCIKALAEYLPELPQYAAFDTAFFHDLPEAARIYPLPAKLTEEYKIRRYGFHGISHKYILEEAAKELGKKIDKINLISCHLGGGWSITAVKAGKPIDTSMGWTPLEGLAMMTRSGNIDPGIVLELLKLLPEPVDENKVEKLYKILNNESGIKGISGFDDFQDLLKDLIIREKGATLAFEIATNSLLKYIGGYYALLEGRVDAIVFAGAIGAGNPVTRNHIINKLKCFETKFLTIKTNEELMIAREMERLMKK